MQRSTSVRYRAADARERGLFLRQQEPSWTDETLADVEKQRFEYYQSIRDLGHERRLFARAGDRLPRRPIGPHTIMSFTTEWRSFLMTVWGAFRATGGPTSLWNAGWLPEMDRDHEAAKVDPALADGLYKGPSRGHVQERYAQLIGMPRGYGYGASMGAWILDYLANWVGEWGEIVHSRAQYRSPAFTGDVSYLDGEVEEVRHDDPSGQPVARVRFGMTNQRAEVMAEGAAELRLPTERLPAPRAGG
jgi:hypothetical protein